jgi:hypothetical protein
VYGLGIEARWERNVLHSSTLAPGAHITCLVKRLVHGVNHPPISSAGVEERVDFSGSSVHVVG